MPVLYYLWMIIENFPIFEKSFTATPAINTVQKQYILDIVLLLKSCILNSESILAVFHFILCLFVSLYSRNTSVPYKSCHNYRYHWFFSKLDLSSCSNIRKFNIYCQYRKYSYWWNLGAGNSYCSVQIWRRYWGEKLWSLPVYDYFSESSWSQYSWGVWKWRSAYRYECLYWLVIVHGFYSKILVSCTRFSVTYM